MKKVVKATLFALALTVLGTTLSAAPAQAQSGQRVQVNVPFDFSIGNTELKAGSYTVQALESGILVFTGDDAHQQGFALTLRGDSSNHSQEPHLVFAVYGTEAFLNQVFLSDDNDCNQLPPSRKQRKLSRQAVGGEEVSLLVQPVR